jgi:hypothetical protein
VVNLLNLCGVNALEIFHEEVEVSFVTHQKNNNQQAGVKQEF